MKLARIRNKNFAATEILLKLWNFTSCISNYGH